MAEWEIKKLSDIGLVKLDNTDQWLRGQWNELHAPSTSGSGVGTRINWNPNLYPVTRVHTTNPTLIVSPNNSTYNGIFMAIEYGTQLSSCIFMLDELKFHSSCEVPVDEGQDQMRIYYGKSGWWFDV